MITDFLKTGRDNALTRAQLVNRTGLCDRTVREHIEIARSKGAPIISSAHGKGYYLAESDEDIALVQREYISRGKKMLKTATAIGDGWHCRHQIEIQAEIPKKKRLLGRLFR